MAVERLPAEVPFVSPCCWRLSLAHMLLVPLGLDADAGAGRVLPCHPSSPLRELLPGEGLVIPPVPLSVCASICLPTLRVGCPGLGGGHVCLAGTLGRNCAALSWILCPLSPALCSELSGGRWTWWPGLWCPCGPAGSLLLGHLEVGPEMPYGKLMCAHHSGAAAYPLFQTHVRVVNHLGRLGGKPCSHFS